MLICKNFDKDIVINSVEDWHKICPPEKTEHWKVGRSAMELAKDWTESKGKDLEELLGSKAEFEGIIFEKAAPEFKSKFDEYRKKRQHDLLILASDKKGPLLVSLEAKADEEFDQITKDYYVKMIEKRLKGETTFLPDRIEKIILNNFDNIEKNGVFNLRYQFLTATAGTIEEAKRRNVDRAVFVVSVYRSDDEKLFDPDKYKDNMKDLNAFIKYISDHKITSIQNNEVVGPFKIQDIDFYIAKKEKRI